MPRKGFSFFICGSLDSYGRLPCGLTTPRLHQLEQANQRAEQERLIAQEANLRAQEVGQLLEQERLRAERLAAKLRELGIEE